MQLELTPDQQALREELRTYFRGLLSAEERETLLTERHGELFRAVVRRMGDDGWMGVGWPTEYGGRGFGDIEQQIFANEAARADIPLPSVTLQTVGPTLQAYGTERQKQLFLPRILSGDVHFAIGYTEPEAGTDLASLRTTARRDGDHYVVNGQKAFTTGGHEADYVWLAVRTTNASCSHRRVASKGFVTGSVTGARIGPPPPVSGCSTRPTYAGCSLRRQPSSGSTSFSTGRSPRPAPPDR